MSDLDYYRGKRVCVTGSSGLIGHYAVELLQDAGASVRARRGLGKADLLNPDEALEVVSEHDNREPAEIVINCAGITGGVGLPGKDPVSYVGPATAMVCNVLHACHLAGVKRFGFLSSTTVYAPTSTPVMEGFEDGSNDGEEQLYPLYRGIGESKRFLERLCRYYHETTGIGIGIVRPSGAYGRYDNFDPETSHVVPGMIERALRQGPCEAKNPFEIWGDGQDVRDIIHAEDVARGLLLAVAKHPDCTPINIASGVGVTTGDLADEILRACGYNAMQRCQKTNPSKPSALKSRTVNIARARELLGFEPRISLADGLADTVAWRKGQL